MNSQTLDYTPGQAWEDEIAQNTRMFFEADRLDTLAYQIIESYSGDAKTWLRFTEAKKLADAQRTAAYQEWMRIHRAKGSKRQPGHYS
ncbi:hypothetical protein SAMN05216475_2824 [Pseudomonas synxantha]|uniref:Uncharacterized protein n=1 Tax=Pseudomonas synxantha TaxID=47883 RepID=A0AAX3I9V3_9PSED|nr:hypothetical protein [Pseudomonas synxantha]AZE66568.1 hypothetical protein C4K01_2373 [Pseudomonas synxantha]KRP45530.1 hypothetical protein TU77_28245 [Pseudomonas synxantha]SDU38394.1 hypothetical protein SAMN05216475_2824 [Pseudomonas synxantha]VTR00876.1 Uncharacterised protein [Pseudomonas synxantha]